MLGQGNIEEVMLIKATSAELKSTNMWMILWTVEIPDVPVDQDVPPAITNMTFRLRR